MAPPSDAGANRIKVAISDRHQVYQLPDHLEEAHQDVPRIASAPRMDSITWPVATSLLTSTSEPSKCPASAHMPQAPPRGAR
jgi:hypothetical protein